MKIKNLFYIMMLSVGFTTMAFANISPFSANYQLSIENKYQGTATRSLKQVGNQWQYQVNAQVAKLANAQQSSYFTQQNGVILPVKSSTQYKILGIGRTSSFEFNHAQKQYISTNKGKTLMVKMPKIALDDLTLELQIREDLKNNQFRGNYLMAGRHQIEDVLFRKSHMTKITVPAGTFEVIQIDRVHDDKDRKTSFWLAPKLDYLPIKVLQNNDGKTLEMQLTRLN